MISVSILEKSYGELPVLKGISADLQPGEAVVIIGPNGSGKTTFIKSILGMIIPDKGQIICNGQNTNNNHQYRTYIGYMPQIGHYPENMKIGQLFNMMKDLRPQASGYDEELLELFGLRTMFHKTMRTLSGGTTQKVSAALAFLFQPRILILDEPTAGLDPVAAEILKSKITKAKSQGCLIVVTSHIMSEVEEIADRVLYLHEGKIQFFNTVATLKQLTSEERLGRAIAKLMTTVNHA
ncbi:MAG: ABC transporter ATP-binding protein [Chitinophagales bacterium]